jgi:hypothetical protein
MKWIKASEILPDDRHKGYYIRFVTKDSNNGCKAVGQFYYHKGTLTLRYHSGTEGNWHNMNEIEWLDESDESAQPSAGYSKEQMGEAYGTGYMRGCEEWDQKYHSRKEPTTPNLTTYLRSLPPIKDAGWLTAPIINLINSGKSLMLDSEKNDPHVISWVKGAINLLELAINTYNNSSNQGKENSEP